MGDIAALAKSIGETGLLQPVGVTSDLRLIPGEQRLRAFQVLGREMIPARTIDIGRILDGEFAENEIRKEFTMSERVAISRQLKAEAGERRGGDYGNQHTGGTPEKIPDCQDSAAEEQSVQKPEAKEGKRKRETRAKKKAANIAVAAKEAALPATKYSCIVCDPP